MVLVVTPLIVIEFVERAVALMLVLTVEFPTNIAVEFIKTFAPILNLVVFAVIAILLDALPTVRLLVETVSEFKTAVFTVDIYDIFLKV